jgi:ERF superfamily protein
MSNKPLEKISLIPESETLPATRQATPMSMLDRAVAEGASIEVLEKLMGLQERWESNQARKMFDAAVADAKAEIRPIVRNSTGHNSKKYADFAAIASAVDPIISRHGLSYRFRTNQTDKIAVTCVLSHKSGHYEETTLCGPADTSGNKNAIQAIGSTLTYLQRYSLVQALGLAASNDDDGRTSVSSDTITQEQADDLRDLIEAKGANRTAFLKWAKRERMEDIPADQFESCKNAINNYQPPKKV